MTRLRKLANEQNEEFNLPEDLKDNEPSVTEAAKLVEDARLAIEDVVDSYHKLFDSLNILASEYKGLYDELKMVVKFPNEQDAEDVAQMKDHFNDVADHFEDEHYLASIIGVEKE